MFIFFPTKQHYTELYTFYKLDARLNNRICCVHLMIVHYWSVLFAVTQRYFVGNCVYFHILQVHHSCIKWLVL